MTASATSRAAYQEVKDAGRLGPQEARVMQTMDRAGKPMTRNEITLRSGLLLQAVCGRVNTLVAAGRIEVESKGRCPITGRPAEFLRLTTQGREALAAR